MQAAGKKAFGALNYMYRIINLITTFVLQVTEIVIVITCAGTPQTTSKGTSGGAD